LVPNFYQAQAVPASPTIHRAHRQATNRGLEAVENSVAGVPAEVGTIPVLLTPPVIQAIRVLAPVTPVTVEENIFLRMSYELADAINVNRVVELEMSDGSKSQFAIWLAQGGYYGQKWRECPHCNGDLGRTYPTWKTKKTAEKQLAKFIAEGIIK
jgi:hypothetical protein